MRKYILTLIISALMLNTGCIFIPIAMVVAPIIYDAMNKSSEIDIDKDAYDTIEGEWESIYYPDIGDTATFLETSIGYSEE